jgi:RNA polymerase sigma factor (sigma-70 family)
VPQAFALMPSFEDPAEIDKSLVARAVAGERAAFAELCDRHYDFIYRVACKWLGRRQDAEDIAQEVCVKLASVLKTFDGRSAFTSWLYRITLNAVRDSQRAGKRRDRKHDGFASVHPEDEPPEQEDATAARELWAAVQMLPPQQQQAVMLVYAEEMNHAQASEIMGCKEATVSWHIHEARKTLRGLLR